MLTCESVPFPFRTMFQNGPRRQGSATPRKTHAPLTAPGHSEDVPYTKEGANTKTVGVRTTDGIVPSGMTSAEAIRESGRRFVGGKDDQRASRFSWYTVNCPLGNSKWTRWPNTLELYSWVRQAGRSMLSEEVILSLVGRIYDAAGEPKLWPAFLEKFADAVHGTTTSVILFDVEHQNGNLAAAVRMDPYWQRQYDEHYAGADLWGARGKQVVASGSVATGQMLCSDGLLEHSEFYNDFLRPMDTFHQFCGVIRKEQSVLSVISCLRPKRTGPFAEEETRLLQALMPHLQRAIQLHQRIVGLERKAESASDALDRLPIGFLMVGTNGKILMLNRHAEDIVNQDDGLVIAREGLCTGRSVETKQLHRLIHGAAASASGKSLHSGGAMTASRPSMRRPFEILVIPLRSGSSWMGPEQAAAGVFVSDPETQPEGHQEVLSRLFCLTPAEARLASALMQGMSLERVADQFRLGRNTVRSQLQKIFQKTGVRRQAELVRLLWNSPARLRLD